ncbi:hypothetical protein E4U12_007324, partial [Claviceps purpurea]
HLTPTEPIPVMSIETSGIATLKSWKTSVGTAIPFPEGEDEEIEALVRAKNPKALAHLEGLFSKSLERKRQKRRNGVDLWLSVMNGNDDEFDEPPPADAQRDEVTDSPIPSTYEKKNLPVLRGTSFVLSRRSLYLSCTRKVETALAPSADSHSCTAASATSSAEFLYGGSADLLQAPSSYVDGVKNQVGSPHVRSSFGLFPGRSSCFISVFMGASAEHPEHPEHSTNSDGPPSTRSGRYSPRQVSRLPLAPHHKPKSDPVDKAVTNSVNKINLKILDPLKSADGCCLMKKNPPPTKSLTVLFCTEYS